MKEKRKKKYRTGLFALLTLNLFAMAFLYYRQMDNQLPNQLFVFENGELDFNCHFPIMGKLKEKEQAVFGGQKSFDFRSPIHMQLKKTGSFQISLKLFGFITWKNMNIEVVEREKLIPGGEPIGIYVKTDGLLVLGTGKIAGEDGFYYEPALNIINTGDYIESLDGKMINTISDLTQEIQQIKNEEITVGIRRKGEQIQVKLKPVKGNDDKYHLGIWIREDTQGIGTLTYCTEEGSFAALGHGITDADTGELLEIKDGKIYQTSIINVIKGQAGEPGELIGYINRTPSSCVGTVDDNTICGIFGESSDFSKETMQKEPLELAFKQEITTGKAYILCEAEGELEKYEIEIEKLQYNLKNTNKDMVIRITDPRLLEKTNGIVQGMSGSPIIQNGKIVGAVTHVLVQNSAKGYGIFIENMRKVQKMSNSYHRKKN